jgi:hypothetical protein
MLTFLMRLAPLNLQGNIRDTKTVAPGSTQPPLSLNILPSEMRHIVTGDMCVLFA